MDGLSEYCCRAVCGQAQQVCCPCGNQRRGGNLILQEWIIVLGWCALGVVFYAICKKKYKESFGILVELISDEDAATLMPEADDVELDKVIDAAIDRVLARKAS